MNDSQLTRFLAKVRIAENGCWIWTASLSRGYGQFQLDGRRNGPSTTARRPIKAHIVSYEHFVGPVPARRELHHLCGDPTCVNPDHLRAVTHAQHGAAHAKARKRCRNGHPRTPENLRPTKEGYYICRPCHRENERKRRLVRRRLA